MTDAGARAELDRRSGEEWQYGAGVEVRWQRVRTTALSAAAPDRRTEAGAFGHLRYRRSTRAGLLSLAGEARADRDGTSEAWVLSRALTVGLVRPRLGATLAVRTSYSPPTLGDQFFRDAVGVEPNPDLRAERVPLEVEASLTTERRIGGARAGVSIAAYRGDTHGMIVWAPDFRSIWSPLNVDVARVGLESQLHAETASGRVRASLTHSWTRVTYDRAGSDDDDVQVLYRPRHTAAAEAELREGPWLARVGARYTGTRYPAPARLNALPGFWTSSAALSHDAAVGRWLLTTSVRGERLFDERGALIFGFPDPGRVLHVELGVRSNPRSPNNMDRP